MTEFKIYINGILSRTQKNPITLDEVSEIKDKYNAIWTQSYRTDLGDRVYIFRSLET